MPSNAIRQVSLVVYGQPISGLTLTVGETVLFTVSFQDPNTRLPLDLTSANVQMAISAPDVFGNPTQPVAIPPGGARQGTILIPATNGIATFQFNPSDTVPSGVPVAIGLYLVDIFMTDSGGNRLRSLALVPIQVEPASVLPSTPIIPLPSTSPLALGQGFTNRGIYSNSASYSPYDVISFPDSDNVTSTYLCISATTGHAPPNATFWLLWASGIIPSTMPTWTDMVLLNGWVNQTSPFNPYPPAGYYKDPLNRVHVRGLVGSGSIGSDIFVFPSGFIPKGDQIFVGISAGVVQSVIVSNAGHVATSSSGIITMWFSFLAEQ